MVGVGHYDSLLLQYLHPVGAVATVVHGCRHGHDERGYAVAHQVEVASARVLALEHLHQHDVELHPLQEHPRERRQEEEVEESGEDSTGNLWVEREREEGKRAGEREREVGGGRER